MLWVCGVRIRTVKRNANEISISRANICEQLLCFDKMIVRYFLLNVRKCKRKNSKFPILLFINTKYY